MSKLGLVVVLLLSSVTIGSADPPRKWWMLIAAEPLVEALVAQVTGPSIGVVGPPIVVTRSCVVTLTQVSGPTADKGWGVQFTYQAAGNPQPFGERDTSPPFEQTRTLDAGTYTLSGTWTRGSATPVSIPPTTYVCGAVSMAPSSVDPVPPPAIPPPPPAIPPLSKKPAAMQAPVSPIPVDCGGKWSEWQVLTGLDVWSTCIDGIQSRTEIRVFMFPTSTTCPPSPETRVVSQSC